MQIIKSDQQIEIRDERNGSMTQTYFKIPGTCPSFRSDRLPGRDRRNVRDLVGFLWNHCIDAYVHVPADNSQKIEVLASAKSPELYMMANAYLHTKINRVYPDRTLRVGHYVKGKGGEIERFKNGMPKIKGRKFDVRLSSHKKFPDMHLKFYSGLRLTPRGLFKGRAIELIIVPEDFFEDSAKEEHKKKIWQEWLERGSDVYYVF